MHIILAYIKFLLRSTNQHGVHSPFVYNLVTRCFYDKEKYPAYNILKRYRKSLLKDQRTIQVTDFGAGSKVFKSNHRKVSEIAKNAGLSPKRARLLNRLVRYLDVNNALELGTSLGMGTAGMAAGNVVNIITIEGCSETAAIAREQFKNFNFSGIDLRVGKFEDLLEERGNKNYRFQKQNSEANSTSTDKRQLTTNYSQLATGNSKFLTHKFDLLYIDGNHRKEATISYFEKLLPTVHNDSVMIFDDIHWSKGMEEAWKEIKQHPKVKVTIDTFQWGLVFFRREQEKEHFVIRI